MKFILLLVLISSSLNCGTVKNITFEQALSEAQEWVGQHDIYAVGESANKDGEKIILVFTSDIEKTSKKLPNDVHGYSVYFYHTDEIVPHEIDDNE